MPSIPRKKDCYISVADIAILFAVMFLCPQHTFMILTKRPERMNEVLNSSEFVAKVCVAVDLVRGYREISPKSGLSDDYVTMIKNTLENVTTGNAFRISKRPIEEFPFKNIWLGVSVENQATADERIPLLLSTPAHIRFLSMEPLLGEVDLSRVGDFEPKGLSTMKFNCLNAKWNQIKEGLGEWEGKYAKIENKIDWVIVGGESGIKARPMNPSMGRKNSAGL